MNKKAILIAAIVLVVAGAAFFLMRNDSEPSQQKSDTEQQQSQTVNAPSLFPMNEEPTVQAVDNCTRTVDAAEMKAANVEFKNKQATISVRGFGDIKIDFYDTDAPKTVENFVRLAESGYFNCLTFHRVAKGFVIQGGDPFGNGTGGDSAFGGEFADELNPATPSYKAGYLKGVLAMANHGPNTNSSQFFILLADANDNLSPNYTIFGKVSMGQDVVDRIGQVDITPQMGPTDGKPKTPVVMEKVIISNKQ